FGGGVIRARGVTQKPGENVLISLRPEALRLVSSGDSIPVGWATLSGTLGEVEYLGPVTRFSVALAAGTPLQLMALAPPAASGPVTVAYDPQSVVVVGAP